MVTRFTTITATVVFSLALTFGQPLAAEDKANAGFHDAMVEFLTIQNAAYEIEGQMTYAIAQQTLNTIAGSGVEITQPMQDIVLEVSRSTVGARFGADLGAQETPLWWLALPAGGCRLETPAGMAQDTPWQIGL